MAHRKEPKESGTMRFGEEWTRRDLMRRTGQTAAAGVFSGSLATFLAACGGDGGGGGAASNGNPARGGTYTESGVTSAGFNPVVNTTTTDRLVHCHLFDPLIGNDAVGDPFPMLAKAAPEISPDGLTYTFTLRDNLKWTDGKPLTSKDVVFTYGLMSDPKYEAVESSYRGNVSKYLKRISAPDATTVVMELNAPYAPFLLDHCTHGIVPEHVLGSLSAKEINSAPFNSEPTVSSGAFKFVEWAKDDHVTLERNPDYYLGAPYLDRYIFQNYPPGAALLNNLRTGQASGARVTAPADFEQLQSVSSLQTYTYPDNGVTDFFFQLDPSKSPGGKVLADKRVRQALVWALDREGMAKGIYRGFGAEVADSFFASVSWAFNKDVNPKYSFDPQKASQLLEAAGWAKNASGILEKDGEPLRFVITAPVNATQYVQCAQTMQSNWKDIGCDVSLNMIQYAELLNRAYFDREFDVIIPGYAFKPDPDPSITFHSRNITPGGSNAASFKSPEVDRLLDQAVATTDPDERRELYYQVGDIVADELPAVPLVRTMGMYAFDKRFQGISAETIGTFTNLVIRPFANKIWIAQ
jgi:peptide/nickel transport system substrate-binding protein